MERFYYSQRESILLGYNNNNPQIQRPSTNPSTPSRNTDVDFNDVFGGPPRRSSVNEMRHSLSGLQDLSEEAPSCSWPPVFGEDNNNNGNGNRRRYSNRNNDFFDDIFGGEESPSMSSTPRRHDRDPFSSKMLSPARPLPSAADPIPIGSSCLPAAFSLPAKLTRAVDLPTFGSPTRSRNPLNNTKDGIVTSNGLGPSDSHLSRFSTQREELKNHLKPSYRQGLLSQEFSNLSISDKGDKVSNLKQDLSINACSDHFQLTSLPAKLTRAVDLPTFGSPTRSRNPPNNTKDGIVTSNGLGPSDSHLSRFSTQREEELKNDLKPSYRQGLLSQEFSNLSISDKGDKVSNLKQDLSINEVSPSTNNGLFHFSIYKWASKGLPLAMPLRAERNSRTKDKVKLKRCSSTKEWMVSEITTQNDSPIAYNGSSLTKNRKQDGSTTSTTTQNGAYSHQIVEQIASAKAQSDTLSSLQTVIKDVPGSPISCDAKIESNTHSISEIGFSGKTEAASETQKLECKPLQSLFNESDEKQDYDEMTKREREENKTKNTKKLSAIFDVTVNPKKREEKTISLKGVDHSKAASQSSLSLGENMVKGRVKGKVKEFVRIFNQEAITKPRVDSKSRLQDSAYKQRCSLRTKNEVEGYPEQSKKENSAIETINVSANNLSPQDDISASAIPDISSAVMGDKDGSFHGNFMIQVLAQDENEVLQNQENQEIQVIDNKIQQWSKGKEGNIRSLLSTLQYVLWPECGWKPLPLVDIIEGNAVKRAYQRALLCLHPDKLQQKGAASHQKYIAEKVFDILQEAWTQFTMLGAL